jgi:hypothetical protein
MLEGITVMTHRMESRRRAYGFGSARAYGEARLNRSVAADMLQFLQFEAFMYFIQCDDGISSVSCLAGRGGRPKEPKVFIDEMLIPCGLVVLGTYRPEDLYLLEVYDHGGQIRAYTYDYLERTGRRPTALIPINLPPPSVGGPC